MQKGDLIVVHDDGQLVIYCVVGLYSNKSGENLALLAVIDPNQLIQAPVENLLVALSGQEMLN
jgi:hypothetical protein